MIKKFFTAFLLLIPALFIHSYGGVSFYGEPVFVARNPGKGFNYGYYYYVPKSIHNASKKFLLVEPNNTGTASDDMEVHDRAAQRLMTHKMTVADELGCVLLVPVFERPRSNDLMYTHALNRLTLQNDTGKLARVDMQLIKMIDDVRGICGGMGIDLEPKVLMDGFSASGSFVNRFTTLHPELVQAVASGGINCMPIIPVDSMRDERLIYPVGVADIEEIIGVPFNSSEYIKVPQFIFMGAEDTNDTLPYSDAFGDEERNVITKVLGRDMFGRWELSKRIYEGQGCSALFKTYEGVGHTYSEEINADIVDFFRCNMQ